MPVRNNPLGSMFCPNKRTKCSYKKTNGRCKKLVVHVVEDEKGFTCMDVKRPVKVGNGK